MQFLLQPCHILLAALIGWANERQRWIIEFQNDQIQASYSASNSDFVSRLTSL